MELRSVHRYPTRSAGGQISIGQIVLIYDEKQPRGLWRLGAVKGLIRGSDGEFRGATVFTHSEGGRSVVLNRPVQHLYPLEVQSNVDDREINENSTESLMDRSTDQVVKVKTNRPKRKAATLARDKVYAHTIDSD